MWNVQDRCCAREQCGVPCAFGGRYMARTVWTTVGCCSLSCRPDRVAACLLYRAQDPCFSPPSLREWDPGVGFVLGEDFVLTVQVFQEASGSRRGFRLACVFTFAGSEEKSASYADGYWRGPAGVSLRISRDSCWTTAVVGVVHAARG